MTDLLRGWPGASGAPSGPPASSARLPAHVNPIPAPKSSRRAKYGGVGAAALEEQKLRRQPAPRVVRPKPLRGSQLFLHIIRTAESQQQQELGSGLRQQGFGHEHSADEAGGDDNGPATTTQPAGRRRPPSTTAAAVDYGTEGVEAVASNGARAAAPAPGLSPAEIGSGGFRRRAKLFADSRDAPHPHTTARIVARLAACRDWRHPLSSRLLPTYLPLFDEHAAAYFFRHVPTLQPLGPSSLSSQLAAYELDAGVLLRRRQLQREQQRRQGAPGVAPDASRVPLVPASEERGFRLMVEAVCSSLLPKIPHFGPRALSYMAAGLGRMGIWYAPAVCAWDAASVGVLGTMRPDQLVSALEGRAQLAAAAAAEAQGGAVAVAATGGVLAAAEGPGAAAGGRGTPPHAWREAAVVAVGAALGDMRVDELARVMEALFTLGVQPPPVLVEAACRRVVAALQEAAAAISTAAQPARAAPAAGSNDMNVSRPAPSRPPPVASLSASPATTGTLLRLAGLEPAAGAATAPPAAGVDCTAAAQIASGTPVMSAAEAIPSAPFALHPSSGSWQFSPTVQDRLGHAGRRVQPPGPDLGEHLAAFVCALGRSGTDTGPGHLVPSWWLDWLVAETAAVLEAQVGAMQRQRQAKQEVERVAQSARGRRAMRRAMAAAAELQQQTLGASAQLVDAGSDTSQPPAAASAKQRGKLSAAKATPVAAAIQPAPAQAPAAGVSSSAPGPFFSLEAMAALLQGAAGLWRARQADQRSPSAAGDVGDGHAPPRAWLNLALSAAVHDLQGRLSPAAAAAAADSARAAAPTAVITAGNVSLAEAAAIASAAGSAAAASRAAADAAQPTSVLLAALLGLGSSSTGSSLPQQAADGAAQLQSFANTTELWRTLAGPDLGLRLVPHLSPAELQVWVQALAAWRGDSTGGGDGSNVSGGGGPAARPSGQQSLLRTAPPPDVDRWSAAVDVASRTRLDHFTGAQLCRLPVLAAAAGLRLPPGWAAAYVRNLTERLVALERSSDAKAPPQDVAAVCLREAAEALAAVRTAAPGAWPFLGAVAPDVVQALATTFGRVAASVGGASGLESGTVAGSAGEPAPDCQAGRRQRQRQGVPMQPDATRARVTALQLQAVVAALEEAIGGLQV